MNLVKDAIIQIITSLDIIRVLDGETLIIGICM